MIAFVCAFLVLFSTSFVLADLRKSTDSMKVAKEAAMYIVKEGKKMPKGASDIALDELKKVCSSSLHKGCYFWEKSGKIMFQPLDSKGDKDGKIYELEGWLKRLFNGK